MTKKEEATQVEGASSEAREGARKLRLSVTRMKKMRSQIKAGVDDHSGSSVTWNNQEIAPIVAP
ncbi:MAG TPA: hypothetical protein VFS43_05015 [Polyangiaceae bacterium]|nr:hypothetical protein [Polyangiaceae bacterium]